MKRLLYIFLILFHLTDLFPQWQIINSGSSAKISSIFFVDPSTGYFADEYPNSGNIYKSTNGGTNWQIIYNAAFPVKNIYFMSQQNGFAVGREHILTTTNGGNSWVDNYKPNYEIYDIRNVTSNYILAVGFYLTQQNTAILQSYTGGNTWTSQLIYGGSTSRLLSFRFPNGNTGYTCGEYGTVMKIVNGGSWDFLNTGTTNHLYSLSFIDSYTGYVAGSNSTLKKTTNGGYNWSIISTGFANTDFRAVSFYDAVTGYLAGVNGFVARTVNSGLNWSQQTTNTSMNINSLISINRDTLLAACDGGVILRTYNGGIIGIQSTNSGIPRNFRLYQNYPNPFNPSTRIVFEIPQNAEVKIAIYDNLGRELSRVLEKHMDAGKYFFDFNSSGLSSGIYFCKMSSGEFVQTTKMSIVK